MHGAPALSDCNRRIPAFRIGRAELLTMAPLLDAPDTEWSNRDPHRAGATSTRHRTGSGVTELPKGAQEGDLVDGKYRIGHVIGEGAMGTVVEARDVSLHRKVAIKFLKADALGHADAVARFLVEARAAAQLASDYVARVYEVGTLEGGAPYIVMECLDGCDLAEWLRRYKVVGVAQAVEFILQACDAISEAHDSGIVHRDVKPANLFAVDRGNGHPRIKVLDFGISKTEPIVSATMGPESNGPSPPTTGERTIIGSPLYMSPEQMESARDVDARTDIWALGVTLYQLLTGKVPFEGTTLLQVYSKIIAGPPSSVRESASDVPPALESIVLKCLERDRARRYATVSELVAALEDVVSGAGTTQVSASSTPVRTVKPDLSTSTPPAPSAAPVSPAVAPSLPFGSWARTARSGALWRATGVGVAVVVVAVVVFVVTTRLVSAVGPKDTPSPSARPTTSSPAPPGVSTGVGTASPPPPPIPPSAPGPNPEPPPGPVELPAPRPHPKVSSPPRPQPHPTPTEMPTGTPSPSGTVWVPPDTPN
jgi:serine/threonine protein kinase